MVMPWIRKTIAWVIFFAICLIGFRMAANEADPLPDGEDPIVDLDPLVIIGARDYLEPEALPLDGFAGIDSCRLNIVQQLADLPGVSLASRGTFADEPIIRGLGFDRVATDLNGLRLPNASPTRTHAPIGQISNQPLHTITVSRFLSSLGTGPPVSGGRISLQSLPPFGDDALGGRIPDGRIAIGWYPGRDGEQMHAGIDLGTGSLTIRTRLDGSQFGNTTSGGGREIPSRHEAFGGAVSVTQVAAGSGWTHSLDGIYRRQLFTENASLPLDTDNGEFWVITSVHTLQQNGSSNRFRLRFGFTEADATLSNRGRPAAPMPVVTDTAVSAAHADVKWVLQTAEGSELSLGIDGNQEKRDAIRRRGSVGVDAIWPDIRYRQAGFYVQFRAKPSSRWSLRTDARFDYAKSRASLENRIAFGRPLMSIFRRYNDSISGKARQIDRALSANLLLNYRVSEGLRIYAGAGSSAQIPPPTERYRAFLNSLGGGFELGYPGLDPERKQELVIGALLQTDRLHLRADFTVFHIEDFIWRQRIGDTVGTLPLSPALPVFGYRNVAAAFHGFDLTGTWRISDRLQMPFSVSWSRANLRESGPHYEKGDPLPEIPPPDLRIGAVYRFILKSTDGVFQWMLRHTARGQNDLPALNPLYADTPAHTQHDVSLSLSRAGAVALKISLLNIFDAAVYPYLSPPVSSIRPASGDLDPGDRVPGPGRELVVSLKIAY